MANKDPVKKRRLDGPKCGQEILVRTIQDMDENSDPNKPRKRELKSTLKAQESLIRQSLKSKDLSIESPNAKYRNFGYTYYVSAANSDLKMRRSGSDAKHCSDGANDLSVNRPRPSISLSICPQLKKPHSDLKTDVKSKYKYANVKIRPFNLA